MAFELPKGFTKMPALDKARLVAASKTHLPQTPEEAAARALRILKTAAQKESVQGDGRHLLEIQQIFEQFGMRCTLTEHGVRDVIAMHLGEDVVNKEFGGLKFMVRGRIGAL